jgi:Mrp family chromosome partitioning ATPase
MSRNFELLQKLEQERQSQSEVVPFSLPVSASETTVSDADIERENETQLHAPDEVCTLVRRLFLLEAAGPRVVVFSSVERGAGCSWMAAHCAQVLATQIRRSVCLVDANFAAPALHELFNVENRHGFAEAMLHSQTLAKCATQVAPRNLWLLTSGQGVAHDTLLRIESLRVCMRQLREQFDYAIIDAPPWNSSSHAELMGSTADGIVLVLKANSSRRGATQKLVSEMKSANVRLLGAVLNQRTFPIPQAIYDRL